ncbi:hypothetical protein Calag_1369 [Caldisphaera lagunensis DSM 15908]|uniref:Uncharacterized protein n=1 Tax=Caldisphaera lagunensis (strain DSM 15908 / JCM 11604 / ANMR 0165 / IC-154) TaxID=1056495 RepID=L0AAZ0_CALLD|nr:hypothetical protein Calag_1369 [Caldisphaera lagunensis DSM 15908]
MMTWATNEGEDEIPSLTLTANMFIYKLKNNLILFKIFYFKLKTVIKSKILYLLLNLFYTDSINLVGLIWMRCMICQVIE